MTTLPQQKIQEAYALLNRHSVYFYFKKVVVIALEVLCYAMALALLIGLFYLPTEFVMGSMDLNEEVHVKTVWEIEQVTAIMFVVRMFGLGFVVLFLLMALLLGYTRRKDNRIRKAALLLEPHLSTSTL